MKERTASLIAWLVAGLTLLLTAAGLILMFLSRSTAVPGLEEYGTWAGRVVATFGFVSMPIVGSVIAAKQPRNPYGWVWLILGFGLGGLLGFAQSYAIYALFVVPGTLPLANVAIPLAGIGWSLGISMLPFTLLLFPTGCLPSPRWRIVAMAVIGAALVLVNLGWARPGRSAFVPVENPFAVQGAIGEVVIVLIDVSVFILFIAIVLGVVSLIVRFRRAIGEERQQLKWFVYAAALFVGGMFVSEVVQPLGVWDSVVETMTLNVLPIAIGIAILRYHLYDIDVIINRTLVYGALTALLVLLYWSSVVALQSLFQALSGHKSQLAIVASTLAIAALFNPLRRRIQAFIDRRFYRRKYDAAKTLEAFSAKLREETDLDRLSNDLLAVIEETLQPEHVSLWLREPERTRHVEENTP